MSVTFGQLEVNLKHASGLKDVDWLGRQDPYCVLICGERSNRTKTHTDGGKNPVWNEAFKFDATSASSLVIQVYDENVVLRDVAIGECKISLQKVLNGTLTGDVAVPVLTKKGKHHGDVFLSLAFRPAGAKGQGKGGAKAEITAEAKAYPAPASRFTPNTWVLPTYADTDCWKHYEGGKLLGKGTFGTTYQATKKGTKEQYAIKVISKKKLCLPEVDDVRREVNIMHHLAGHPNVVNLVDVFEDRSNVCIVMELCSGGELFDAIVRKGRYVERDAAHAIRTMVAAVAHCHEMGVMHRDLKPENFLLQDCLPNARIKSMDFGLSCFFKEGQVFTDIVGSPYYVAPEVLRRAYSKEADIWSCGVILYILLCGYPPFHGANEKAVFRAVMNQPLDLTMPPWNNVSEPAKDCVRRMLQRDPARRATAQQILQHDWMRENGCASDNVIELEVVSRIKKFSAGNRLKKEAVKLIAANLPADEISGMREMFKAIDADGNGSITVEELRKALLSKGRQLPADEVERLVQDADIDGDGTIDYEEFLAATITQVKVEREEHLKTAFQHFDVDGNGMISHDELCKCLSKMGISSRDISDIISEVDTDGNGEIDYGEFCHMMRSRDL